MGKRTRIINDPSYLVPLLRTFGSRTHKKIFDALSNKWMTRTEIDEFMGTDSSKSLHILKKAGLLESQWRVPEAGQKPSKEYHSSYSARISWQRNSSIYKKIPDRNTKNIN